MDYIGLGMVVLGLLWAAGFAWAHFRALGKAKAAESWPSAMGRIHACEVVEEESTDRDGHTTTWYNPVVAYRYTAGGREYESRRLRFGSYRKATRKKAEAMLAPYRVGGSSAVRYNPEKPEECVLETVKPGPIYLIMALFGFLFVAMGLFWQSMSG